MQPVTESARAAASPPRPWMGLGAQCALVLAVIVMSAPPVVLKVLGRGGQIAAIELVLIVLTPVILWVHHGRVNWTPSLVAWTVYLVACLPSALVADDRARFIYGVAALGYGVLLLHACAAWRPGRGLFDAAVGALILPIVVLATVIILHQAGAGQLLEPGRQKIELPYGGSNFLASMLLMSACVPLARGLSTTSMWRSVGWFATFGWIAFAVVMTGSRLGMMLLPVGFGATVCLELTQRRRRGWRRVVVALAVAGMVGLMSAPYVNRLVEKGRFQNLATQRNLVTRFMLMDLYWRAFQSSPWIGIGVFNGRVDRTLAILGESTSAGWGGNQKAHNWALQTLGDTGLLGFVAFLTFLGVTAKRFWRAMRWRHNPWHATSVGLFVGFVLVTLHGLLEPNFHGRPFLYLFLLGLGLTEQMLFIAGSSASRQVAMSAR